ncbi:hypothetical protein Zm00014a_032849 [Zea mays]|jgi:hypothetical protein|uniref:Uncharacterized protein n=1 Tax=Zea mays TaxID=4577 RepID=A0A3L6EN06_MAIZE|nr:hypothetical protein Zm00014a_032849 [Zea mays]
MCKKEPENRTSHSRPKKLPIPHSLAQQSNPDREVDNGYASRPKRDGQAGGPTARQSPDSPRAEAIREARGDSGSEGMGERWSGKGYIEQGSGGEARLPLDRGAGE